MFDPDSLTHSIADLMKVPGKAPDMARKWSRAYANYAINGQTVLGGNPVSLDAAQATLQGALTGTFSNPYQLAPQTASSMAAAFTAFWLLPPVATLDGAFPGVVTAVAGTALLQAALLSAWFSNFASQARAEQAARGIAAALDAFSRTVVVTIATIPTPTVGPLS
jgi:hypothetical protein